VSIMGPVLVVSGKVFHACWPRSLGELPGAHFLLLGSRPLGARKKRVA